MSEDPKDKTSDEDDAEDSRDEPEAPAIDHTMVGAAVPPPVDPTARSPETLEADLGRTMAGGAPPPVIPGPPPAGEAPADEPSAPLDQTMMGPAAPPPVPPAGPPDTGAAASEGGEAGADLGRTMAGAGAAPPSIQPGGDGGHVDAGAALGGVELSADLEMTIAGPPPGGSPPAEATMPAPPKARPSVRLERVQPADRAGSVPLDPGKDSFVLGRSRESDLPLFTLSASRQHARLLRGAEGWSLEPVGDRRVSVDDRFIQGPTPLRHGSRIRLGEDEFVFDDGSAPLPGPTMGGRGAAAAGPGARASEPTEEVPRRSGRLVLWVVLAFVALALVLAGVLMSRVVGGRERAATVAAEETAPATAEEPEPVVAVPEPPPVAAEPAAPEAGPELLPIEAEADDEPVVEVDAAPEPASGVDVEALLGRADELRRQYKLTTPPGENAYDLYQEVLAADPGNAAARAGVEGIRDTYLAFARREIGKRDPAQAAVYVERAEAVGAGGETRAVRQQIEALRREIELGKQTSERVPEPTESTAVADDPPPPPPAEEEEGGGFLFGIFD